eukprot:TRINITY_DN16747_c0_g1_i1.p1 TRINITY_DN16747_c0_g1~~TRINITY_DN16747_c0_g1_i1.p1  ORF type:complete len:310 (+),score=109.40 TRINITY_DN16747_c0_g1_i1:74-931(+)
MSAKRRAGAAAAAGAAKRPRHAGPAAAAAAPQQAAPKKRTKAPAKAKPDAAALSAVQAAGESAPRGADGVARCWWGCGDADYSAYHDAEWGRPVADDVRLFEKLCLEGFQAGLSWLTILRKRDNFRKGFAGFDFRKVARFGAKDVERLLGDPGIVRHRGKIESTINNAKLACKLQDEMGSIAAYVWGFEPEAKARPKKLTRAVLCTELSRTPESAALSADLRRRGWNFVGPTTCYAFMQAMGIVNDHCEGCAHRPTCEKARKDFKRPTTPSSAAFHAARLKKGAA